MRLAMLPIVVGAALVFSGSAQAQKTLSTISVDSMASLLQAAGHTASVIRPGDETAWVDAQFNDIIYEIYFYGCESDAAASCESLEFHSSFTHEASYDAFDLNDFNFEWIFGKSYRYDDGALEITHTVLLSGGVMPASISEHIGLWEEIMSDFVEFIGYKY